MSPPPPSLRTITLRLQNRCYHQPSISKSFVFKFLQIHFSATPMFSHLYKTLGGGAHLRSPVSKSRSHVTSHERSTHALSSTCALLCRSFALLQRPHPLFSTACTLFSQNTRGGGTPPASFGSSSPTQRPPLPPDSLCESRAPVAQSSPQITPWRNHARPPR
jgi:hypothetical protein